MLFVRLAVPLTLGVLAGALSANRSLARPIPSQPQSSRVEHGQALFLESCARCHGQDANGATGPSLIESSLVQRDKGGDLIGKVVLNGRPALGMPAFPSLNAAEVADIVRFLHAQIQIARRSGAGYSAGHYLLREMLTGNVAEGKAYFYGKGGCSACHSPTGDLAGIANEYSPTDLEALMLYPPFEKMTATVTLKSGKICTGTLLHLDAFYVAIRGQRGAYHSWPLKDVSVKTGNPLEAHRKLLDEYDNRDIHNLFAYLETLK